MFNILHILSCEIMKFNFLLLVTLYMYSTLLLFYKFLFFHCLYCPGCHGYIIPVCMDISPSVTNTPQQTAEICPCGLCQTETLHPPGSLPAGIKGFLPCLYTRETKDSEKVSEIKNFFQNNNVVVNCVTGYN